MKATVKIEICPDMPEEVVIRCKSLDPDVIMLQQLLSGQSITYGEMAVQLSGKEYFIDYRSILYFETLGERVCVHTAENMFYTDRKLYELARELPKCFMRVSKSCIINTLAVNSVSRSIVGNCEATFAGTNKTAYISRMYYKSFHDSIEEMRLKK